MRKASRLPHEEMANDDGLPVDGLPVDGLPVADDVEGHRLKNGEDLGPRLPGTGGDLRRPSGGGEVSDDDVESHYKK